MKILVCMHETVDATLNLEPGLRHSVLFREGLPLILNPDDATALSMAIDLRSQPGETPVEITLVSIGPERVESYLRNGLALGADKAVRIRVDGYDPLSQYRKALLLSAAARLFETDLVLTGSRSLDNGNGIVGPLLAARLDYPCIIDTVDIEAKEESGSIIVTRDIGHGERERLECSLPAVLAIKGDGRLPYASLDRLTDANDAEISLLSSADLGVSPAQMSYSPTSVTSLMQPRPPTKKVPAPDSSLPAFYRILKLLEGGIARREGRMLEGSTAEIVDQLYDILLEEGVIRPAKES